MTDTADIGAIAIVGMAGRFPGAPDLEAFWRNLQAGVESVTHLSEAELERAGIPASDWQAPNYVRAGALLEGTELFDAGFFGYSAAEAALMDPQQRLFLEVCWEALEHAGYAPDRLNCRAGVYAGQGPNSYLMYNLATYPELLQGNFSAWDLSDGKDFLSTRVSYCLNLAGPSITVQTACSTALAAVAQAYQSLLQYQCDIALAGAVAVRVPAIAGYHYYEGGIYSPDGRCRPLDACASGTVPGSGLGAVVLKRLEDAQLDGDTIHAIIRGCAVHSHGATRTAYGHPCADGQAEAAAEALAVAQVDPDTVSYVEMHGTGTALGDAIELSALSRAYRRSNSHDAPCRVGSVKGNIGYAGISAGMAGLLKVVLALRERQLPPTIHVEQPNPALERPDSPFTVNARLSEWPVGASPRRAAVHAYGVGGSNAHVVLEEAPTAVGGPSGRPFQLLIVSARSVQALRTACSLLAVHLPGHPEQRLTDIAYTLQTGRSPFAYRWAGVCRTAEEAAVLLREAGCSRDAEIGAEARDPGPLLFLVPPNDEKAMASARELQRHEPAFHSEVEEVVAVIRRHAGRSGFCMDVPAAGQVDRALQEFVVGYALGRLWMRLGARPEAVTGHQGGLYAASCLGGKLPLDEAISRLNNQVPSPEPVVTRETLPGRLHGRVLILGALRCVPSGWVLTSRRFASLPDGEIPAPAQLLDAVGRLWVTGYPIDWAPFYAAEKRLRVPLPTYPFERKRHWIEPQSGLYC